MKPLLEPHKPRRRAMALVLVLGAVVVLFIATAVTSQAFVTKVGHDTLDDFAPGRFGKTGLLDLPGIDSVHLLPIGLFGEWVEGRPLPRKLTQLSSVAAGGQVVVMGGVDDAGVYTRTVWVSTIGSDGALGAWVTQTYSLPHGVSGAAAVAYPKDENSSWVYLLGGAKNTETYSDVHYTTLDYATGTSGEWTPTAPLPMKLRYLSAVALDGYVYAVGGYNQSGSVFDRGPRNKVYYAAINPADGSLGAWQETSALPKPLNKHLTVAYQNDDINMKALYAIGGQSRGTGSDPTLMPSKDVYFADVNPDGSLTAWSLSGGTLPRQLYAHHGVVFHEQILATGGVDAEATEVTTATVRAALIDPDNPTYRLYNWGGTVGAWETGPLLPWPRAFHQTVADQWFVYTLGGVDTGGNATDSVYWGAVDEPGARYAPQGFYESPVIDLKTGTRVHQLEWSATISHSDQMTMTMSYKFKPQGGDWQTSWSDPFDAQDGVNTWPFEPPLDNVRLFQYRVDMATDVYTESPLLNWVDVYYEVDDPELAVRKDTGLVISADLDSFLDYTIYYTNSGAWVAENVVLTESLPAHTSYAGSSWNRVGSSNLYTYSLGNLAKYATGKALFQVKVNATVPQGVTTIDNAIDIGYPPMLDELGQTITDPYPENNHYDWSNPLNKYAIAIAKSADPASGSEVYPGRRIEYTLTYSNTGQSPLTNLVLQDSLPVSVTYVAGSIWPAAQGDDSDPTNLEWNIDNLAAGASGTVGFAVTVNQDAPVGTSIANSATASADKALTKTSNTVWHPVGEVPLLDLELHKSADPVSGSTVSPGQRIEYTLVYSNTDESPLTNVVLRDSLPVSVTYAAGSIWPSGLSDDSDPQNLEWNIGNLAVGASGSVGFAVTVNQEAAVGASIANSATASADKARTKTSNTVWHPVGEAPVLNLELLKSANPASGSLVSPGDPIEYTLNYQNTGTGPLTGLELTDLLPVDVTYVAGSIWPAAQGDDSDPTELKWTIGALAPGASGTAGFSVQVNDPVPGGLSLMNHFAAQADGIAARDSNSVAHITHIEAPDLTIVGMRAQPPDPNVGEPFDLIVTVRNQGSQDADDGEFWVEVYIKPYPAAWPQGPADHAGGYCTDQACTEPLRGAYVQYTTSLAAGEEFPFRFEGLSLPAGGIQQVFAQADICFVGYYCSDPRWGWYLEQNESNNIRSIYMQGSVVHLPLIERGY